MLQLSNADGVLALLIGQLDLTYLQGLGFVGKASLACLLGSGAALGVRGGGGHLLLQLGAVALQGQGCRACAGMKDKQPVRLR